MSDADKGKLTFVLMLCIIIIIALGVSYQSVLDDKNAAENQITELKAQLKDERDHADVKFDRCMKQFLNVNRPGVK